MSALDSLSSEDRHKWDHWMQDAKKLLQELDDIKGALRDSAKALAEEFGIKPKEVMAAARTAFKNDLEDKKESMDIQIKLLEITGHG